MIKGLATVLNRLMKESNGLHTAVLLEKRTAQKGMKVGKSTVDRVSRGESAIGIDNLHAIAQAFDMQAWELLQMASGDAGRIADHAGPLSALSADARRLVELIAEADQRHGSRPGYWTHLLGLAQQLTSAEPAPAASGKARPTPEFQALVAWGKNKKMSPADIKEMVALARKSIGAGDASTRAA